MADDAALGTEVYACDGAVDREPTTLQSHV